MKSNDRRIYNLGLSREFRKKKETKIHSSKCGWGLGLKLNSGKKEVSRGGWVI